MKYLIFVLASICFVSCIKKLDNSELNRDSIFDPNGVNMAPWYTQTNTVISIPQANFPSHIQYIFKYKVTNQLLIDNRADFEIIYYRISGNNSAQSASRPKIFKEGGAYYFEVSAYNLTNPDGHFCFIFSLNKIGQEITSAKLSDCWQI